MSFSGEAAPMKELQGPRPTPLKVNKDSRGIRKPPVPPPGPVIIYMKSPEIIHTKARDFMALVQRLTGKSPTPQSSSSPPPAPLAPLPSVPPTPAMPDQATSSAYFTSLELDGTSINFGIPREIRLEIEPFLGDDIIMDEIPNQMLPPNGILSPAPSSLAPTPSSIFLQPPKPYPNLHELSPMIYTNRQEINPFTSPMQRPCASIPLNQIYVPSCLDAFTSPSDLYRIQ